MFQRRHNFYQGYYNNAFKTYFPHIVREHKHEYDLYFLTFAFENQFHGIYQDQYLEYFKAVYQKINQYTVNNPSHNGHKKAKMILVPEKSYQCVNPVLDNVDHYHGILMIRKEFNKKFVSRCISNSLWKYIEDHTFINPEKKMVFELHPKITKQSRVTSSFKIHSQQGAALPAYDTDILKTCSYMTKYLGSHAENSCKASLADIRDFDTKYKSTVVLKSGDKPNFDESDVLLFADIKSFNAMTYQPKRRRSRKKTLFDTRDDATLSPFERLMKRINNEFLKRFYAGRG